MRIGVLDIGGTAIKSGVWNGESMMELREQDTHASKGGAFLMEYVKRILEDMGRLDAVGISTAGQVDAGTGRICYANENIPGYTGTEVREILEEAFRLPVAVENDVHAAALGEMHFGAARELSDFLCLTYGTGVGGAIVMDGRIYAGADHAAGSFGGIVTHPEQWTPEDPSGGCYERYPSTGALVRMAMTADPGLDNGRKIFEASERRQIRQIIDNWIDEITIGLVTLVHVFNPADVLLGGGVLEQPGVLEKIRRRCRMRLTPNMHRVRFRRMDLGNRAGLMGAAWLAEEKLKKEG